MGYKIIYGAGKRKPRHIIKWRLARWTVFFFLLFLVSVRVLFAEELALLYSHYFPAAKVDALMEQLRRGQSAIEAITAFCEDLFYGQ